ncbi:MAG: tRNA uridine(34) 5-carboxymethylaminomethyl modification radical SAM/GNAT enzyme Elp3 [Patescibacteria group bacterium]|nr:tRNA uridine(34) 5-carboxymethylaminomethyl modification radical SAM/GNAT enzyme Elp3 [Patescibacteria group bacterium]
MSSIKTKTEIAEVMVREAIARHVTERDVFFRVVQDVARSHCVQMPPVRKLLAAYRAVIRENPKLADTAIETFLTKSRVRSLSGVAVVTVLTKPYPCPGKCVYCPDDRSMPKSYLPNEPAAMRAAAHKFDPFGQVTQRLRALTANGHPADKIELIVKGGTWSAYPRKYQQEFIKDCFDACNSFGGRKSTSDDLAGAHKKNESARYRVIGLTLETRPDRITPQEIVQLRELGCTRIEMGVQSVDDAILKTCRRGHDSAAVVKATRLLKDAGYKCDYHMMPQLPGASPKSDERQLKRIFEDPDYRPDMLKIYPCTVLKKSPLHRWWKDGRYKPYPNSRLKEVIIAAKQAVPRYCRISRIIRDIPSDSICAGNPVTSLRQVIQREMKERGLSCDCLRCREIGRKLQENPNLAHSPTLTFDDTYEASGGEEHFLSIEDPGRQAVFAFCRLRLPATVSCLEQSTTASLTPPSPVTGQNAGKRGKTGQDELNVNHPSPSTAFLRELHTYGHLVPIDKKNPDAAQHKGYGKRLMAEAERITHKAGFRKMAVISGIGVRAYYRKLGYRLRDTYMVKTLRE